ncbi:MAG: hypothetical protein QXU18_02560 [Thermoplasmatales archaeon]
MSTLSKASVNNFIMKRMAKRYGIDQSEGIEEVYDEVSLKRRDIDNQVRNHQALKEELALYQKFVEYDKMLAELILIKRFESGISTLIFFLYSILAGIVGAIMEILAFLTTTGLVGHIILSLSIAGGVGGVLFALYSMKKERMFIYALKEALQYEHQYADVVLGPNKTPNMGSKSAELYQKL